MEAESAAVKNVVLVHGAWVDGSGWRNAYEELVRRGYSVSVTQHRCAVLDDDVADVHRVLDAQDGPTVLVGHSYGGVIISAAGSHPNVASLVYVTAFAPGEGESVNDLIADLPEGTPVPPILPPVDGMLMIDHDAFPTAFAADLPAAESAFMADAMPGWGVQAANATVADPAYAHKASYYLIALDDQMLGQQLQRRMAERAGMTIAESPGSHSVYNSQPVAVADVIDRAAGR
ncbi:alpha/beta fold hydrolase [Microbacterium gorillae]|uniref:alpha/beta fold hydrolase n=1 Tax=Microbacterium gorillae TaxID=1231063 RepID=UPI00058C5C5E|nr:alpha/beta hydrolase [Microbacterium gorillae]